MNSRSNGIKINKSLIYLQDEKMGEGSFRKCIPMNAHRICTLCFPTSKGIECANFLMFLTSGRQVLIIRHDSAYNSKAVVLPQKGAGDSMQTPHIRDYHGKRVHMIGIGGSSMSGLAQMLVEKGYKVTGSDSVRSHSVEKLEAMGIPVAVGHREENVRGADMVVYSAAILPDNPERLEIQKLWIPNMERAVLLGQLMEGYETAVGISGTHGKTTTTAMLSQMIMECGLDPTIHIGGRLDAVGGSTRIGSGNAFIAEACEFNGSFLYMRPTVAVVLNIEEDRTQRLSCIGLRLPVGGGYG